MLSLLTISAGVAAATGALGALGLKFGTDSRPGFSERLEGDRFGHVHARQIPGS